MSTPKHLEAQGEDIKRSVAVEFGVPLITIARPHLDYPRQTTELADIIHILPESLCLNPSLPLSAIASANT